MAFGAWCCRVLRNTIAKQFRSPQMELKELCVKIFRFPFWSLTFVACSFSWFRSSLDASGVRCCGSGSGGNASGNRLPQRVLVGRDGMFSVKTLTLVRLELLQTHRVAFTKVMSIGLWKIAAFLLVESLDEINLPYLSLVFRCSWQFFRHRAQVQFHHS